MCLFRKKKVMYKKSQSVSNGSDIAKDFFTLLDEERKKSEEKQSQAKNNKGSLGRDFYSIFNDDVETKAEANTPERETANLGRLFCDIFDDSVKDKKLTKEEKHRLYMEKNRKSIISAYNGDNIRELSLMYRCSQSDIITILRESIAKNDKNCLVNNVAEPVTQNSLL